MDTVMSKIQLRIVYHIRQAGKISLIDLYSKILNKKEYVGTTYDTMFRTGLIHLYEANFIDIYNAKGEKINISHDGEDTDNTNNLYEIVRSAITQMYKFGEEKVVSDDTSAMIYFSMTKHFDKIQRTIGFSITDEISCLQEQVSRELILGKVDSCSKSNVFVIMPFDEHIFPVYEDHIKKVCDKKGYSCERADDISSASNIMNDIWSLINNADIIICDCTGKNPNVFYELGLAHAIGKNVICITQNTEDIPFDIKHIRYIKYEYNPRGMVKFEKTLGQYIASNNKTSLLV